MGVDIFVLSGFPLVFLLAGPGNGRTGLRGREIMNCGGDLDLASNNRPYHIDNEVHSDSLEHSRPVLLVTPIAVSRDTICTSPKYPLTNKLS
jgi:hypothetical protein